MNRYSFAIEERRHHVATLYLQRKFQTEIAHIVGVDQKTVSRDLQHVQRQWLQSALRDFDTIKAEQLATVDKIEREAWEAYYRSCQPREVTVREATEGGEHQGRKVVVRTEQQVGDPRFLERIQKCVEQRCTILGLIAPPQINLNILIQKAASQVALEVGLTPAEVLAEAQALLAGVSDADSEGA